MAAFYTFEDHSGLKSTGKTYQNPYDALIDQCNSDASQIQAVYERHRTNRNAQQKDKLIASDFAGVVVDEILAKLEDPTKYPGYQDPRNCLVFWVRPTAAIQDVIDHIQRQLNAVLPNLWLMPRDSRHMTALEVTHSLTAPEIDALVQKMAPRTAKIADWLLDPTHRTKLVKPYLSFDAQAFALSFVPAATKTHSLTSRPEDAEQTYTYHHLRKDLYAEVVAAGLSVASRYVVPSAHLTIGRYTTKSDLESNGVVDHDKVKTLLDVIEHINQDLEARYWSDEWLIGSERGITCRKGMLWYGGGETVYQSEGY